MLDSGFFTRCSEHLGAGRAIACWVRIASLTGSLAGFTLSRSFRPPPSPPSLGSHPFLIRFSLPFFYFLFAAARLFPSVRFLFLAFVVVLVSCCWPSILQQGYDGGDCEFCVPGRGVRVDVVGAVVAGLLFRLRVFRSYVGVIAAAGRSLPTCRLVFATMYNTCHYS